MADTDPTATARAIIDANLYLIRWGFAEGWAAFLRGVGSAQVGSGHVGLVENQ
jgi:hypothetical protein